MVDLLDEISHDLKSEKQDRIIYLAMRIFFILITIILIGVTIYVWKENTSDKLQKQLSINYNKALLASDNNQYDESILLFNQVIEHPSQQYAALAYLNKASILYKQGKFEEAQKTLLEVNDHKNFDLALRELAQVTFLSNQLAANNISNPELNKEIFERLTKEDKPWRLLALQIFSLYQLKNNKPEESKIALEKIMQSPDASANIKNIASSILTNISNDQVTQ